MCKTILEGDKLTYLFNKVCNTVIVELGSGGAYDRALYFNLEVVRHTMRDTHTHTERERDTHTHRERQRQTDVSQPHTLLSYSNG